MDRRNPAHWTHGHESDVALGQGKRSIRPKSLKRVKWAVISDFWCSWVGIKGVQAVVMCENHVSAWVLGILALLRVCMFAICSPMPISRTEGVCHGAVDVY